MVGVEKQKLEKRKERTRGTKSKPKVRSHYVLLYVGLGQGVLSASENRLQGAGSRSKKMVDSSVEKLFIERNERVRLELWVELVLLYKL